MEKELPKMYHNNFEKTFNNNKSVFNSMIDKKETIRKDERKEKSIEQKNDWFTIEQKIFSIFNSKDYIYKADVTIVTDEQTINKRIIGKNANNLITIDNEYIPISIIKDIYKN